LTLGNVAFKLQTIIPSEFSDDLNDAVGKRNFLAHHFWFDRAHLMSATENVIQLIAELDEYASLFNRLGDGVGEWFKPKLLELGVSEESCEKYMNRILAGDVEEALLSKKDVREMIKKLGKQQQLIRVWEFALNEDLKPLIFELSDGSLWQLSDVGLGWTKYQKASDEWHERADINQHLPADLLPRPKNAASWDYEFTLAQGVIMWVKPGRVEKTFKWGLRIPIPKE